MVISDAVASPDELEEAVRFRGLEILERMRAAAVPVQRTRIQAQLLDAMRDPEVKVQVFRLVDVLPALHTPEEVVEHAREYLGDLELPHLLRAGLRMASVAPGVAAHAIRAQVRELAREFVVDDGGGPALPMRVRANLRAGMASTVDLLGEAVVSETEADDYLARNLALLDRLAESLGPSLQDRLPALNLSIKLSALTSDLRPADPQHSVTVLKPRLRRLLRRLAELGGAFNLDMESYRLKDLTLALFRSILEEDEFRERPAAGIAIQAYLRESEHDVQELIGWVRARGRPIAVRLVKGAYWDQEVVTARQHGWPEPVFLDKAETDACYERLSSLLLQHYDLVRSAFASHNVRSCAHAAVRAELQRVDRSAFEFQMLYGMADDLKAALLDLGYQVREYLPVGALLPGMGYLVRRLLENTSNESFVHFESAAHGSPERLLASPAEELAGRDVRRGPKRAATVKPDSTAPFHNAPWTDFTRVENRERLRAALAWVTASLPGRRRPLVIDGRPVVTGRQMASVNPARPTQIVGTWSLGSPADAVAAVSAARRAQPDWARRGPDKRAQVLERLADLMEQRRFDLSALEILEAGKPWIEADADVAEAIDYCRFYAAEMRRLGGGAVTAETPGERNVLEWVPRGVTAIIAPWNFPLAILCGMATAALVAGNAIVLKPAEQTSVLGAVFMDLLAEAGVPPGAANLLTGLGEELGPQLVTHPAVDAIAFTGSRAVGLQIWEAAARVVPGQANLKKVVCEMGGKNALIVDADADLDEAVPAALASAFGYSGQKCSALSRIIAVGRIHDAFVRRFVAACASLPVGDPAEPDILVGPVIDSEARDRILGHIARGRRQARVAFEGQVPGGEGFWVPPTVFVDVELDSTLAREEIFGPVVAIMRARDLDEALALANESEYALTGGIFSRLPSSLQRTSRELVAGNVYLNRGITGALVGRQPFGGFKMSGAGTRAGGAGYLENFMFSRVISENEMRRGFAPPEP